MSFMMAFGLASIMLCLGVLLRAKIPFLRKMLVPASVIAGILGFIFINAANALQWDLGTDANMYTDIVNFLFTISFISISLTSAPASEGNSAKNVVKGALGLGLVWCLLYALTPVIGAGIVSIFGKSCGMAPIYGTLIQFAFCQGPGQSATYGVLYESYGWENAAMVAIAFSAIGFIVAFVVGIPAARKGIRRGLAKHCGELDEITLRGYMKKNEQTDTAMKDTTCTSNIETLSMHFALIGLCYIVALGIAKLFSLIPGFFGTSFSGMMFVNGMLAAYLVRFLMKKLKIDYLIDNTLQTKITGWTSDYLVVCAFMAVSVSIIRQWLTPILIVSLVETVVTFLVCFYFGQRLGGSNDFERTLGLYGTCTGTVPSGISLVRIVDPQFRTSTSVELGACNIAMMLSTPVVIVLMALSSGAMGLIPALGIMLGCVILYAVLLKVFKLWGKKTYSWK